MDPIGLISGGIAITEGVVQFLSFIKGVPDSGVISASFAWNGNRSKGSAEIKVERHPPEENAAVWWFVVEPRSDYTFVRIPLVSSGIQEVLGRLEGDDNDDARIWRWVSLPNPNVIRLGGNPPNAKVDFIVVGYKPDAIIKHFSPEE